MSRDNNTEKEEQNSFSPDLTEQEEKMFTDFLKGVEEKGINVLIVYEREGEEQINGSWGNGITRITLSNFILTTFKRYPDIREVVMQATHDLSDIVPCRTTH